jgi:hypothetical protein
LGFLSINVIRILNKNYIVIKKKKNISKFTTRTLLLKTRDELERHRQHL